MNDWEGLRTAAAVVVWVTVGVGATMAVTWLVLGGRRAVGPDDELMSQAGVHIESRDRRYTAFSSAQIGIHGLLGVMTAALLTYALARDDDRSSGYWGVLVAIAITAVPGVLMFLKWRSRRRPSLAGGPASGHGPKVEDGLPRAVVFLHGLLAATVVVLVVVLLVVG